ncbi:MAG: hypothetical protein KTR14_03920 [Vampirovibrio sp.]|nr:hypothetical protein [Vampirovibrio sp.]
MSEATTETKPAEETPGEEKKTPEEKPFNTDVLQSCTARFSRKAWDLYLGMKADHQALQNDAIRCRLTATSPEAVKVIEKALKEDGGVNEMTVKGNDIELTTTFAVIQQVIKRPETAGFDAVKI